MLKDDDYVYSYTEREIKRMGELLDIVNNISKETKFILINMVSVYKNKGFQSQFKLHISCKKYINMV